jgi:hypothetical protein
MLSWLKWKKSKRALTAPGPSPWYLRAPWACIRTTKGNWTWSFYDDPILSGLSRLMSPQGETVLFVDFYCYIQTLPDNKLLIWYETGRSERNKHNTPKIIFTILSLSSLITFNEPQAAAAEIRANKERVLFKGGSPQSYEVSTTLYEGTYPIAPPPEFARLPELLVIADFGPAEMSSNHWEKTSRAIYVFDFNSGQVTVLPQVWFNEGTYDFGYQWITRVQREQETNQIIGEGIRLGEFRLDKSGKQLQEWLHTDVFYHPERNFH